MWYKLYIYIYILNNVDKASYSSAYILMFNIQKQEQKTEKKTKKKKQFYHFYILYINILYYNWYTERSRYMYIGAAGIYIWKKY